MEIGSRIKARRTAAGLSQEALAEQVFVTRQTLSNWENNKTYPDINSLLRLSAVFNVSLDELVKGDILKMKEQINSEDMHSFRRESRIFTILMVIMVLSSVPLTLWDLWRGLAIWLCICAAALISSFRVERLKKKYDIHTYREIVAFSEGRCLDELQVAEEKGKRPYQKLLMVLGAAAAGAACAAIMSWFSTFI